MQDAQIGLYDMVLSTTLESNKSLFRFIYTFQNEAFFFMLHLSVLSIHSYCEVASSVERCSHLMHRRLMLGCQGLQITFAPEFVYLSPECLFEVIGDFVILC